MHVICSMYIETYSMFIKDYLYAWWIVGPKQQKKFRKLVTNRIKWSEDSVSAKDSGK